MRFVNTALLVLWFLVCGSAQAQLQIEITQGIDNPTQIGRAHV